MKNLKRLSCIMMAVLLSFSLVGCSKKDAKEEQKAFDAFLNEEFVATLEDNYINMHILTENPSSFGVDESEVKIQIDNLNNEDTSKKQKKEIEKSKETFETFDRDLLTNDQKDSYDIYEYMLDIATKQSDDKFAYMSSAFESMSGIHTQLPTLSADMTLRNEQDVKNVITLLSSTREYMKSQLEYTKKQESKGTLMLDIDSIIKYCEGVITEGDNSSVLTGLNSSIDALGLDSGVATTYKQQVKEAFDQSFLPAYQDIIDTMKGLDTKKNNRKGLSYLKNGKEYYEVLFKSASGSDKSVKEIKKDLEALIASSLEEAQKIVFKNESAYMTFTEGVKTQYKDFQSMLADLNNEYEKDFPAVSPIQYNIAPIGKDLASGGIAAYFNIPAIDGTTPKQIRVNMLKDALDITTMETFSTLAHEGIPGHMYQVAYTYENMKNLWRKTIAGSMGYQEGYANYVELYSLKYLKDIPSDIIALQQHMSVMQNAIIALLDIGIHYDGWSTSEAKKFLEDNGLGVNSIDDLYYQIQANPTAFIPYYVGYMQIAQLKEDAQKELKDKFNDKKFHEALLKSGSAPFSVVEKNIEEYIKNTK